MPAAEADRATLLRRLSFDLTGLPPTPDEIDAFLGRSLAAGLRAAGRSSARESRITASAGPALARPGPLRRDRRLRVRPGPARRLALSRLGRRRRSTATCRTTGSSACRLAGDEIRPGDPAAFIATGFNRCYPGHGRPERPGAAAAERAQRHHRDDRAWSSSA